MKTLLILLTFFSLDLYGRTTVIDLDVNVPGAQKDRAIELKKDLHWPGHGLWPDPRYRMDGFSIDLDSSESKIDQFCPKDLEFYSYYSESITEHFFPIYDRAMGEHRFGWVRSSWWDHFKPAWEDALKRLLLCMEVRALQNAYDYQRRVRVPDAIRAIINEFTMDLKDCLGKARRRTQIGVCIDEYRADLHRLWEQY